ncbi:hypothetical protein ABPG72_007917 [Tetrahymena utriculariae]
MYFLDIINENQNKDDQINHKFNTQESQLSNNNQQDQNQLNVMLVQDSSKGISNIENSNTKTPKLLQKIFFLFACDETLLSSESNLQAQKLFSLQKKQITTKEQRNSNNYTHQFTQKINKQMKELKFEAKFYKKQVLNDLSPKKNDNQRLKYIQTKNMTETQSFQSKDSSKLKESFSSNQYCQNRIQNQALLKCFKKKDLLSQGLDTYSQKCIERQVKKDLDILQLFQDVLLLKKAVMILLDKEQLAAISLIGCSQDFLGIEEKNVDKYIEKLKLFLQRCLAQKENQNEIDQRILSSIY